MRYQISVTIKGTAAALYIWHNYPTCQVRRSTPAFLARKQPACNIRYHVEGIISVDELRLLPDDLAMLTTGFDHMSVALHREAN